MNLRWVRQEDSHGCGVAAVAMLTGLTYAQVLAHMKRERDFSEHGMSTPDVLCLLAELGYATALLHRVRQWPTVNFERPEWPPSPFGDLHLCQVKVYGGTLGAHFVAMDADGDVLDPVAPASQRLTAYEDVYWVAAVMPFQLRGSLS